MRKAHAQRNLDLSNQLLKEGIYFDWVVTTSFYSSVHFVEHALFPLIENGIEYKDFNNYWNVNHAKTSVSKHSCKKTLVWKYLKNVGAIYRDLFDECNNSRYNNYVVHAIDAVGAKDKAEKIKLACLAKKP